MLQMCKIDRTHDRRGKRAHRHTKKRRQITRYIPDRLKPKTNKQQKLNSRNDFSRRGVKYWTKVRDATNPPKCSKKRARLAAHREHHDHTLRVYPSNSLPTSDLNVKTCHEIVATGSVRQDIDTSWYITKTHGKKIEVLRALHVPLRAVI